MTKDPFFFETRDLTDVPNLHTAVLRTMCGDLEYMACNAPQRLELSDGRIAWVRAGSKGTTCGGTVATVNGLANLPATEIAWQREDAGQGTRVVDNTAAIAAGIAANNASFPNEQMRFPVPAGTAGSTGAAGASGGNSGSGGTGVGDQGSGGSGGAGSGQAGSSVVGTGGGSAPSGAGGAYPIHNVGSYSGCGCAAGGTGAGSDVLVLALASVLSLSRPRRRRRD
jgi:hypothetical protein